MKTFSRLLLPLAALAIQARANTVEQSAPAMVQDMTEQSAEIRAFSDGANPSGVVGDRMLFSHRGGNGGNSIASQFSLIAKNTATAWESFCQESGGLALVCDELENFKSLLNKSSKDFVTVISAPTTEADDGDEREAVNFVRHDGAKLIVVNERKWKQIDTDYYNKDYRKINLVLHEYFSLMGLESSDYYNESGKVFTNIDRFDFDLEKITKHQELPSTCSIRVKNNGSLQDSKIGEVKSKLSQMGYNNEDGGADSRYTLSVSQQCSGFLIKNCSIYMELEDSFKSRNSIVHSSHENESGMSSKNSINSAFKKAFENFPTCD